LILTFG